MPLECGHFTDLVIIRSASGSASEQHLEAGAAIRTRRKEPRPRAAARPADTDGSSRLLPGRDLFPKLALELFVVFVGVSAAFALDDYRDARAQDQRRQAVYQALDRELSQMAETHGPAFHRQMTGQLAAWDRALDRGERPLPPTFKLPGAERPPTGVWDAAVATGSIELINPELFYELARFYNRANSVGVLYQRYSQGAQADIWPRMKDGPEAFWTADGRLRPEILADVQRLRDFSERQGQLGGEAAQLRSKLRRAAAG